MAVADAFWTPVSWGTLGAKIRTWRVKRGQRRGLKDELQYSSSRTVCHCALHTHLDHHHRVKCFITSYLCSYVSVRLFRLDSFLSAILISPSRPFPLEIHPFLRFMYLQNGRGSSRWMGETGQRASRQRQTLNTESPTQDRYRNSVKSLLLSLSRTETRFLIHAIVD